MPRHAAFLRGVSPMNCKMPALKAAFEAAGFEDVRTLLSSGNVVFSATGRGRALEKRCEAAMEEHMGSSFLTHVRSIRELQALLDADPFAAHTVPAGAKRVVTFLRTVPSEVPKLPIERDGARILALLGRELITAYVPSPKGAPFMGFIERTFGRDVTTRTWDTLRKTVAAA